MRYLNILIFNILLTAIIFGRDTNNLVIFKSVSFKGNKIIAIKMADFNHIKVKCFPTSNIENKVFEKYTKWQKGKKVICYTSGGYVDQNNINFSLPIGICIEDGRVINNNLLIGKFDGLFLCSPSGKISVFNLKNSSIELENSSGAKFSLDLSNSFDRINFFNWASKNKATVFQTHLVCFQNQVFGNIENFKKENRRILARAKNKSGEYFQYIINIASPVSLHDAANIVFSYLKSEESVTDVEFAINLDLGSQDIFGAYPSNGTKINNRFFGSRNISDALNLIVYYTD